MSEQTRLVVLVSGSGTNLQAILNACNENILGARVAAVISNSPSAFGLERARKAGVPALVLPPIPGQTRCAYDAALTSLVQDYRPDYVILAGWMRLLSMTFLEHFPMRVINLHPALPGVFPGAHAIQDAFSAFQAGKIKHTGVMVHFVLDEGVDDGPVISQEIVPIHPEDSLETLEERIHQVEHRLLVNAISSILSTKE